MLTMDKLTKEARGPFVYTLLTGKALECVEHVPPEDYQKADGDEVLWKLLETRFPQKDSTDELGEMMTQVFSMRSQDGETLKSWVAKTSDLFERCARKTGVSFPDEARGWLILHKAGLSDEQKAVALARAQGSLKRENICKALRSCFPDLVLRKKIHGANLVEDQEASLSADEVVDDDAQDFEDVELLLSEHQPNNVEDPFLESDVAEVLAASWREKRQELNKLQKARKFGQVRETKKAFRVEIEELKKRTKCHRCGMLGHWSKECRKPRKDQTSSSSQPAGAALVEMSETQPDFVAMAACVPTLVDLVEALHRNRREVQPSAPVGDVRPQEVMLVSSPGYGILDTGCGKTIIGQETLKHFERMWLERGVPLPTPTPEINQFRFGNGHLETTEVSVPLPVHIGGKNGIIRAAVVKGDAPLLISRPALQSLEATIDLSKNELTLFKDRRTVSLGVNTAGQFLLDVMGPKKDSITKVEKAQSFNEVMVAETNKINDSVSQGHNETVEGMELEETSGLNSVNNDGPLVQDHPESSEPTWKEWIREDWSLQKAPGTSSGGPRWKHVHRRTVRNGNNHKILFDQTIVHNKPAKHFVSIPGDVSHTITTLYHDDPRIVESTSGADSPTDTLAEFSPHQFRQLQSQVKAAASVEKQKMKLGSKESPLVVEVFSPPRFAPIAQQRGFTGRSVDIKLGNDLSVASNRAKLKAELLENPPDLLVLCPPCTHEGGWFHLNSTRMDRLLYLKRKARSRSFVRFCCELFRQQVACGKRALFEHPTGSNIWSYPEVTALTKRHPVVKLHMCQYGLKIPNSDRFIRKSTRLLVSHDDMKGLEKQCPGSADPKHACHDVIAGSNPAVGSVSAFAGGYPPNFVTAVLNTVPRFAQQEVLCIVEDQVPEECWDQIHEVAAVEESTEEGSKSIRDAISKLHRNLGHPPNHDLVRILKHAQASDEAIKAAREFTCPACQSRSKPHVPLPAQSDRVVDFNKLIGIDVKYLPGWKPNQKIKSLNIVDQASGFQRVIPFFEAETSNLLRSLLESHWISWAGPPSDIVMDPAQTNLGEPLVVPLENQGINIRVIAAEAHWQLGKTENHGGWFARVLQRVIDDHTPSNKEEWLECVHHAHIKNAMIQHHGFSPQQYVFGRNIDIPSDLLNEPIRIVPATASLTNAAIAKSQEMRNSARKAILELQDSRALRSALAARPRASINYQPGDLVAYWRSQKWIKGELHQNGAWYGSAVVLGTVGRNLILMHRKTVLRCAPEQVRPATSEEKVLANTPESELLGIKDMIEGGALKSRQYVDLTPHAYPTEGPQVDIDMPLANPETPAEESSSVRPPSDSADDIADNPTTSELDVPEPAVASRSEDSSHEVTTEEPIDKSPMPSNYGPVRRRIHNKNGPMSLYRPAPMQQEEFVEIMREVVPHMIEGLTQGVKRDREETSESPVIDLELESSEPAASRARTNEVLSVEDLGSHVQWNTQHLDMEVLIAEYLKKKMLKELPHSKNPPKLQKMVDEGKRLEWQTIVSKPHSVKLHYGKAAANIREKFSDRFIGSRYVLTRKPLEEGSPVDPNDLDSFTVKGRWCLQGHLDPDLEIKALDGRLKSPTLSQLGRMTLMQTLASLNWMIQLGDIKGAFLEAGPLEDKYRPLYAHQPPGGIPGVSSEAVVEICGNLYGQNDAPAAWFKAFDEELRCGGWIASCFDGCLYTLRDKQNQLIGILGVHVDDCALGGTGEVFEKEVKRLRERFPFRKWRTKAGEFCGAVYSQDTDGTIHMSMAPFVDKLKPTNIPKGKKTEDALETHQTRVLRAINGGLNWLTSQGRPDLAAQTSFSQQAFPNPKIHHLRQANNVVRRAKQHSDLCMTFRPINPAELTVCCHSDAAFANVGTHTQAGYIIGFTQRCLDEGAMAIWNPVSWRSYKLPRAVSSTLSAESQAMATASGTVEWLALLMHEILHGPFDIRDFNKVLNLCKPIVITDCKSLYDHLHSPSSPTAVEDRRTSIDIVIIRESVKRLCASVRWVPTNRMLADSLTKDVECDLLRSCLRQSSYQISPEETVLEQQAQEKERRLKERYSSTQPSV